MQKQRGYPTAGEHSGTAARRPQMNPDLYRAVIFSTLFESTERGRRSETGSPHTSDWEIQRNWPCINPDLTYSYCFTSRAEGTQAELQLSAGQSRRVRGGQRSCRWAHASAGSPPKGQCGEGGAWHQRSPIMPFHSQDTWVCKALFQHCNLD